MFSCTWLSCRCSPAFLPLPPLLSRLSLLGELSFFIICPLPPSYALGLVEYDKVPPIDMGQKYDLGLSQVICAAYTFIIIETYITSNLLTDAQTQSDILK